MPHRVRGVGGIDPTVVQRDMARRHLELAEDRAADRMVTGAAQTDQAQRLAGLHGKRNGPDMLRDDSVDREYDAIRRRRRLDEGCRHRAADDLLDEIGRRGFRHRRRRHPPPVAQNRHPVGDAEYLVEAMRDINDADSAGAQPPQRVEQAADVRFRQCGRRLVQNEDVRLHRQRPPDRHERTLGRGERRDGARPDRCRCPSRSTHRSPPGEPYATIPSQDGREGSPSARRRFPRQSSSRPGRDPDE